MSVIQAPAEWLQMSSVAWPSHIKGRHFAGSKLHTSTDLSSRRFNLNLLGADGSPISWSPCSTLVLFQHILRMYQLMAPIVCTIPIAVPFRSHTM